MQNTNGFFFLEPVKYTTRTRIESSRRLGRERPDVIFARRRTADERYFFDRVVRKNDKHFESINVNSEIALACKNSIENLSNSLRKKFETITASPETIEQLFPLRTVAEKISSRMFFATEGLLPPQCHFYKDNPSIILPLSSNVFYILSKSKKEAADLVQFIKSEFEKLNEVTKDFGLELAEFLTGRNYQEPLLKGSKNIQNINYKKPKDEFEEKIIGMCERTTSSFLSNVEVAFTEPTETYEFDIFIGISEDVKVIIEPTNYETIKDLIHTGELSRETLKSKVILGTQDKAQRLGAKSIVIAKGFPEETFSELKKIADSRRVTLLNETNYENELPKIFWDNILEAYAARERQYLVP
jgi:hypothetical protein